MNAKKIRYSIVWILLLFLLAVNVRLARQFPVSAAGETLTIAAPVVFSSGYTISSAQFIDNANSAYFLDPAATDTSLATAGNVGIGTTGPGAKLSFANLNDGRDTADGITWYNPSPTTYGIYRTAGTWVTPNYQQLKLSWDTGIILDPGVSYGKSYVEIAGGGLRVTSGNVGIGTTGPGQKLHVSGGNVTVDNTYWYYGLNSAGGYQPLIRSRGMGYSPASYTGVQVGQTGDEVALFIDPGTIAGGAFNGNNNELLFPNAVNFLQGNSGSTDWITTMALNNGNVGIGTTSPAQKLSVAGTVESTTGGFKFPDGSTQTAAAAAIPAGLVSFFNLAACPSGWTEVTTARGRYIVGLPAAGTLAGTSGTALTNLESRAVGQHLHSVDPASTGVSISDPGHSHGLSVAWQGSPNNYAGRISLGENVSDAGMSTSGGGTGISGSVNIAAFDSANSGSVAGTNAPYIQLLACQKS